MLDPSRISIRLPEVCRSDSAGTVPWGETEMTSPLTQLVCGYYKAMDLGDLSVALACFAPTAIYRRPGYEALLGLDAIHRYYQETRIISSGSHRIDSLIVDGDEVAVQGAFEGQGHAGQRLVTRFADFWRFGDDLVLERNTYFDAAAV
jgi:uncharacterized protein